MEMNGINISDDYNMAKLRYIAYRAKKGEKLGYEEYSDLERRIYKLMRDIEKGDDSFMEKEY